MDRPAHSRDVPDAAQTGGRLATCRRGYGHYPLPLAPAGTAPEWWWRWSRRPATNNGMDGRTDDTDAALDLAVHVTDGSAHP
jgi:hypothetical protein